MKKEIQKQFEEEVEKELGYCSALFMSQECKGTEIVMPTRELKEISDRIGLYFFTYQSELEKAVREDERKKLLEKAIESLKEIKVGIK